MSEQIKKNTFNTKRKVKITKKNTNFMLMHCKKMSYLIRNQLFFRSFTSSFFLNSSFIHSLLARLFTQQNVDLLFDPVFVVGSVGDASLVEYEATQVGELVDKVEQIADVVCDRGRVWVQTLQVLFVHFADSIETIVHRLIVRVGARLEL